MHSATVQDADWRRIGCVTYQSAMQRFRYFAPPAGYVLDECHVDKSGRWLMILETRADGSRRNRIVDLQNGNESPRSRTSTARSAISTWGTDTPWAPTTFNPLPNATILLKFPVDEHARARSDRWCISTSAGTSPRPITSRTAMRGPVSAATSQYACGSNASRVADMADEIICFPLDAGRNADGSLDVLVVAQVMTDLDAAGGRDTTATITSNYPKGIST